MIIIKTKIFLKNLTLLECVEVSGSFSEVLFYNAGSMKKKVI